MARTPVDETAKKKPASKTTAKKATVKKTAAKKATVKKTASVKAPAKKATTKKAPAKKATAKKATAKKTTSQTEQKPKTEQKAHNTQNHTHTPDAATEALREGFDTLITAGRAVVDRLPSFLQQAEKRVSKVLDSASKNYEELEKNTKSLEGKFVKSFKDLLKNRRGPGSGGGKGPQP